jgi:hypothetical protein
MVAPFTEQQSQSIIGAFPATIYPEFFACMGIVNSKFVTHAAFSAWYLAAIWLILNYLGKYIRFSSLE